MTNTTRTIAEIAALELSIKRSLIGFGIDFKTVRLTNPYDASSVSFTCYKINAHLTGNPCRKGEVVDGRVVIKSLCINTPYSPII